MPCSARNARSLELPLPVAEPPRAWQKPFALPRRKRAMLPCCGQRQIPCALPSSPGRKLATVSFRALRLHLLANELRHCIERNECDTALFSALAESNKSPPPIFLARVIIRTRDMEVRIAATVSFRQPKEFGTRSTQRRFAWRVNNKFNWHSEPLQNDQVQKVNAKPKPILG